MEAGEGGGLSGPAGEVACGAAAHPHAPCVCACVSARQPVFDAAVQHPHINTTQRP